ncbi:hypothetical protein PR048_031004 [Dryococelus australis]|uniref:Uncharacterized protein n=1 Tax=Dryococelus australis TaxID=614101 RepID=A0ABQ9G865_9NEOP|nr:hypothetical protein PR048_031004 [Dryococelus australis]
MSISTAHWLSAVTVEGDDWASVLQVVSDTVWTNGYSENGAAPECKGGKKREIPEKTRRPVASFGTIPTCKNPGVTRSGIEPGTPWCEASSINNSATAVLSLTQTTLVFPYNGCLEWLSAIAMEGDDWASLLQGRVNYTVVVCYRNGRRRLGQPSTGARQLHSGCLLSQWKATIGPAFYRGASTTQWLSAIAMEGDDWASLLQGRVNYTVVVCYRNGRRRLGQPFTGARQLHSGCLLSQWKATIGPAFYRGASTTQWLSAIAMEGDDWASLLQGRVNYTVVVCYRNGRRRLGQPSTGARRTPCGRMAINLLHMWPDSACVTWRRHAASPGTNHDLLFTVMTSDVITVIRLVYLRPATATVSERFACSPPAKANRVQSPAGPPGFRKWESCRTMPLVGGFSRGSPVFPAPSFRRRSIFTFITLIGSQDLAVKNRLNFFTHSVSVAFSGLAGNSSLFWSLRRRIHMPVINKNLAVINKLGARSVFAWHVPTPLHTDGHPHHQET